MEGLFLIFDLLAIFSTRINKYCILQQKKCILFTNRIIMLSIPEKKTIISASE